MPIPSCLRLRLPAAGASALRRFAAVTASLLILWSTANAQEAPELWTLELEELMSIRVETVYGASRFLQKVTDAPGAVSIVTATEIRAYGYATLGDILRRETGFSVTSDRNYTYVGVRGFQRPGDYNSRILVTIDGHRLNDGIYDMALLGTEFPMDLEMIERVEIIRGPSSSLYGTNAFLAVVNIVTKQAKDVPGVRVFADAGSLGTGKVFAAFGQSFDNGLDLQLSGSAFRSAGQRRLYFPEFDLPWTNNGVAENLDGDEAQRFLTGLSFKGFTFHGAYGRREKKVPTAAYDTVFNDPSFRTVDARGYADLRYEKMVGAARLTGRVYYDEYRYKGFYPGEDFEGGGETRIYQDFADNRWWGVEGGIEKTAFRKHRLTASVEYRNNHRQDQGAAYLAPYENLFEDRRRSTTWGGYAEDEFSISPSLILSMGVRHDRYEGFGGATNPRVGLIFFPAENTSIKVLWGTAFRAPNAYELYYYGSPDETGIRLKPETIDSREIVFDKYISGRYRFALRAHRSHIRNLISVDTDAEGDWIFVNKDDADTKGAEAEFEARWPSGFGFRAVYSHQIAADRASGSELDHSVRHLATANLMIPLVPRRLLAGIETNIVGPAKTLAGTRIEGYVIPNLTISTPARPGRVDLSAGIYNLLDARYAHPGSEEHRQNAIPQDGRTFRFRIGYTWFME